VTKSEAVTFNTGDMVKAVSVSLVDDATAEGGEYFDLFLSAPSAGLTLLDTRGRAFLGASDQAALPPSALAVVHVDDIVVGESDAFAEFVLTLNPNFGRLIRP
jgi:hypothetical protein